MHFRFAVSDLETAFRVVRGLPPGDVHRVVINQAVTGVVVTLDLPAGCEGTLRHVLTYAAPSALPTLTIEESL